MVDRRREGIGADLVAELTDFTFALRVAGLPVTIERSMTFLRAVAAMPTFDQVQLYAVGRDTLCCDPGDVDLYDETFNWFFRRSMLGPMPRPMPKTRPKVGSMAPQVGHLFALRPLRPNSARQPAAAATPAEAVRHEDLAELSADERAELASVLQLLAPLPARRQTRHAPTGRPEVRRTLRSILHGEGADDRRNAIARTLVLLIDVSASMAPYAEPLLRFAHGARRRLGSGCEVFTLGAGVSRLTGALADRDAQRAILAVGQVIPEWSGGTQLGASLQTFIEQHGRHGLAHGAVVIVFSDGWEHGNADHLAEQARRLSQLTSSFIWVNPHSRAEADAANHGGLVAVQPYCDHLLAGHSLDGLGELMDISRDA